MTFLLFFAAVLPGLLFSFLLFKLDKYNREHFLPLLIAFVLGALITIPARAIETYLDSIGLTESLNFLVLSATAFIAVALVEEFAKFFCVMIYPYQQRFFDEPLDGIVYAVFVSMGFATVENILYAQLFDLATIAVRAITSVPAHASFAIISGYYIGLAKFNKAKQVRYLLQGLFLAVLVHGFYDLFILQMYYDALILLASVTLVISLFFSSKLLKLHLKQSETYSKLYNTDNTNSALTTPKDPEQSKP